MSTPDAGGTCPACPHDREAHDTIGARFCAATLAHGLERGCVCPRDALVSTPLVSTPEESATPAPHGA